jgi:RNA-directed DNA polymerase
LTRAELVEKTYRPAPVRMIPKRGGREPANGGPNTLSVLGCPANSASRRLRDRVVQTAAKPVLEPIFEADLEDAAYGYRPRPPAAAGSMPSRK